MKLIFGILISFLTLNLIGQVKVLKDFDFESHNYKFFFFSFENNMRFKDTIPPIKPFVIYNKTKLTDLKNDWIATNEVEEKLYCGYDYSIYITEDNTYKGFLNVNTHCGEVIAYDIGTSYRFKEYNPFESLIGDGEIYDTILSADTITVARELYRKIVASDSIYLFRGNKLKYLDFDGQFYFYVIDNDSSNTVLDYKMIESEIYRKYPNKHLFVDSVGFGGKRFLGSILCDSSFFWQVKNDIPNWDNFTLIVPDWSSWKSWAEIDREKRYSMYIFTDSKRKFDELVKNTAGNKQ